MALRIPPRAVSKDSSGSPPARP